MPRVRKSTSTKGLNARQRRFVEEYLIDLNGERAAIRAGYSPKTARYTCSQYLKKRNIAEAIAEAQAARSQRTHITQDQVLREIAALQHSTIEHYAVDDKGNLILAPGAPPDAMRAISSLKKRIIPTEHGLMYEVEFKLWNKPATLRMGGEHLGLFKQQVDVSGTVKVVRLPEKAPSAEAWYDRRRTDLGTAAEAN